MSGLAALRAERCDKIYREKESGKDIRNQPELGKAVDALPSKEVVMIAEWDRCTRSLMDGIEIMRRIHERGTFIKGLERPGLDLTTPSGQGILALLSGLAEEERTRILRAPTRAVTPPSSPARSSAAGPSSTTTSGEKPSNGSRPMKAAAKSPRRIGCTMPRLRGWRGRHRPWPYAGNSAGWTIFGGSVAMLLLFAVLGVAHNE